LTWRASCAGIRNPGRGSFGQSRPPACENSEEGDVAELTLSNEASQNAEDRLIEGDSSLKNEVMSSAPITI
jgi:hypothetical protein